ncbi:unnamed protein product [Medioppia subpectinata]|uniref:Cytochrome P450 n=1 Tax=Medioppia subpectinata TaxID=1979941 RepID=A0A7R9KTA1_9ACAR|nr:unnamed protein product [Medioppia subpectinata]CAG2109409.1 unnamed protein product [Medioppia subpectinata]
MYRLAKSSRVFDGNKPILYVAEPALIKQILVKDFNNFRDRRIGTDMYHPLVDQSVSGARGDDWRRMRSIVSPAFSTAKMRRLYKTVGETLDVFADTFGDVYGLAGAARPVREVDVKEAFDCLAMDVIARCAFASHIDTLNESDNEFVTYARAVLKPPVWRLLAAVLLPRFALRLLDIKTFMNEESICYFYHLLRPLIASRKAEPDVRHDDFVDLLIRAERQPASETVDNERRPDAHHVNEGEEELMIERRALEVNDLSKKFLTEEEVIGHAFGFITAGFDSTANALAFMCYELALNPDVQQRLYDEVMAAAADTPDGELGHDVLPRLAYLDAVFSETLRLHSPTLKLLRVAAEDYPLGDTGITIPRGQSVVIPIHAIHHSPEYYPEPNRFLPDRFMPENRRLLTPYTYLPFGSGPRNCVGMSFALMATKLALARIVLRYEFSRSPRTPVPLCYEKHRRIKTIKSIVLNIQFRA